jgi:hypothetical protein
MKKSNTLLMKGEKIFLKKIFLLLVAMCAYQIGEHLHLAFADHLDLYSQQANPNFRFPSERIPLFSE